MIFIKFHLSPALLSVYINLWDPQLNIIFTILCFSKTCRCIQYILFSSTDKNSFNEIALKTASEPWNSTKISHILHFLTFSWFPGFWLFQNIRGYIEPDIGGMKMKIKNPLPTNKLYGIQLAPCKIWAPNSQNPRSSFDLLYVKKNDVFRWTGNLSL